MPLCLRSRCSTAERERELYLSSASVGLRGSSIRKAASRLSAASELGCCSSHHCIRGSSLRASSCARRNSTTIAHSRCFHVMMPILPPSLSRSSEAAIPRLSSSNSSLRWMRNAWKVGLAGCIGWYSRPLTRTIRSASSVVRLGSEPASRARTMASAIRRAATLSSSPYERRIRISSARGTVRRNCQAGSPLVRSKRRSSGPSCSGLKPRVRSSSCGEEMPRSMSTPVSAPSPLRHSAIEPKGA
mmetsp:Transcript_4287/g.10953  ORF Transcript_4287/g.10953 Transcript_4287/m.10953 type:complete len:244 (-) Transcript_4287:578-1309(-)